MAAPAFGRPMRTEWALDPDVVYLNHGTVGAPPRRVLAAQQAIRDAIERQPARYLLRELSAVRIGGPPGDRPRLRRAAEHVASFLGARGDDLVFVDNVTAGVNAVLRSLALRPGDEIVLLDHAYGGVATAARFLAREADARVRTVAVPWPPDAATLVARVAEALGPRTRAAIIDHVTAESALVLPLATIAATCRSAGVPVLADGAHAPGAIPVDVPALGVAWYAANLHKWAWAPRSCGILWAAPERQSGLHPPVISWGLDQGFTTEFDWPGTRDPSPALAAPAGIALMQELGVERVQRWNHDLAWRAGRLLAERWGTELVQREEQIGTMVTVSAPAGCGRTPEDAARLRDALLFEDGIEVQVHAHQGRVRVRVSAQVYVEEQDVTRLADAVGRRA